jgi:hypothetical protein
MGQNSSWVIQGFFRSGSQTRAVQARPSGTDVRPARVAAHVQTALRMPTGGQRPPAPAAAVQRHPEAVQRMANGEAWRLPADRGNFGVGTGQPLPPAVLQKMESFFGTSLSDVRVHVGTQAPSIGAVAFTQGSNIYFAPGEYNPTTSQGQRLLGHELSHVVQQRAGRVRNPFGAGLAVVQDRALEAEAERMGRDVALYQVPIQPRASLPARPSAPPRPVAQRRPVAQARAVIAGGGGPSLTAPGPGRIPAVLQPKVVVHGAGNDPRGDYALMKVLHQITQRSGAGYSVTELDSTTDFSGMQAGEILYIAGHGNSGTGEIRGLTTTKLLEYLNHPRKGVPPNIGGIHILTCYGGMVKSGQSLAQRVANGLQHGGIVVKGAMGYSFGTPQSASTGLNSVLSTNLDGFYSQSADMETMLQQLKARMAAHNVDGSSLYKSEGTSDDNLRTWIRKFIHRRDTFERNMKSIVNSYNGRGSLNWMLDELRHNNKFQRLVNRQYELHQHLFELPGAASYASATS